MEEYSMDTELFGVELTDFQYQAEQASDTALGRTPVLLIGKEALSALSDSNGHRISEKRLNQLLEGYQDLVLTVSFQERPEQIFSCRVAAILKEPADRICFSIDQAKTLAAVPTLLSAGNCRQRRRPPNSSILRQFLPLIIRRISYENQQCRSVCQGSGRRQKVL